MRVTTQHATTHSPRPDHHCPPHESPLPLLSPLYPSLRVRARVSTPGAPPLSLPRATQREGTPPRCTGRDNHVPPQHGHPPPIGQRSTPHTPTAPTPGREHASKQASKPGQRGRRDHTAPPPQASAPTPRKRKHPKRTRAVAQTPNPNHPQANTPTTSPNKAHPQANTKSAHTKRVGKQDM